MITRGVTRKVFVFKRFVIKIPNYHYSWYHFIQGLMGNIDEANLWKWSSIHNTSHLLCPVLWSSWGGWIIIMKRADVERHEQEVRDEPDCEDYLESNRLRYKKWIDAGYGGDDKCDNYGYIENRLVKIDYATSRYD